MTLAAALLPLAAVACLAACDTRDESFASAAEAAELIEKGWLPPLPEEAHAIRVAWDLDVNTSFFCGEAFWEDVVQAVSAVEDAMLPAERPEAAPDWWWQKARLGTETVRVPGTQGHGWTLTQIGPVEFCGATLDAWRGRL